MSPAKKALTLGVLDDFVGFHLRIAQIKVFRDFEQALGALEVTPAAFSVLVVLHANPGATQTRLAQAVHLDRSSVVPLLDKLERRALLRREASATDRRNNHLYLTAEGEALLETALAQVRVHEQRTTARLSAAECRTLKALLDRVGA